MIYRKRDIATPTSKALVVISVAQFRPFLNGVRPTISFFLRTPLVLIGSVLPWVVLSPSSEIIPDFITVSLLVISINFLVFCWISLLAFLRRNTCDFLFFWRKRVSITVLFATLVVFVFIFRLPRKSLFFYFFQVTLVILLMVLLGAFYATPIFVPLVSIALGAWQSIFLGHKKISLLDGLTGDGVVQSLSDRLFRSQVLGVFPHSPGRFAFN